jgi:hypothetical protein
MRILVRCEWPHPGAQLSLFEERHGRSTKPRPSQQPQGSSGPLSSRSVHRQLPDTGRRTDLRVQHRLTAPAGGPAETGDPGGTAACEPRPHRHRPSQCPNILADAARWVHGCHLRDQTISSTWQNLDPTCPNPQDYQRGSGGSVATSATGRGVGEHPVGDDASRRNGVVLLIDRLLPRGHPQVRGGGHTPMQPLGSRNSSGVRINGNSDSPVTLGYRTLRPGLFRVLRTGSCVSGMFSLTASAKTPPGIAGSAVQRLRRTLADIEEVHQKNLI